MNEALGSFLIVPTISGALRYLVHPPSPWVHSIEIIYDGLALHRKEIIHIVCYPITFHFLQNLLSVFLEQLLAILIFLSQMLLPALAFWSCVFMIALVAAEMWDNLVDFGAPYQPYLLPASRVELFHLGESVISIPAAKSSEGRLLKRTRTIGQPMHGAFRTGIDRVSLTQWISRIGDDVHDLAGCWLVFLRLVDWLVKQWLAGETSLAEIAVVAAPYRICFEWKRDSSLRSSIRGVLSQAAESRGASGTIRCVSGFRCSGGG